MSFWLFQCCCLVQPLSSSPSFPTAHPTLLGPRDPEFPGHQTPRGGALFSGRMVSKVGQVRRPTQGHRVLSEPLLDPVLLGHPLDYPHPQPRWLLTVTVWDWLPLIQRLPPQHPQGGAPGPCSIPTSQLLQSPSPQPPLLSCPAFHFLPNSTTARTLVCGLALLSAREPLPHGSPLQRPRSGELHVPTNLPPPPPAQAGSFSP